jgi:hypothetical protein
MLPIGLLDIGFLLLRCIPSVPNEVLGFYSEGILNFVEGILYFY